MRKLLISIVLCLFCTAQGTPNRFSSSTGKVVLSGAATTFTLQQASVGSKKIILEGATVSCTVACEVTQAENGAAATSTAGSISCVQPCGPAATATTWTASNVGAGTTIGANPLPVPAAGVLIIDLSKVYFSKTSTSATNYSISTNSITGTVVITFIWSEQ